MKIKVLLFSFFTTVLIYFFTKINLGFCIIVNYTCQDLSYIAARTFVIFPLVLVFSLITYKLPERVFIAWWKFAKFAIPIIFGLTFLINAGVHHISGGQWQDMFDIPVILTLYAIFVIGSLVQIVRGWRE
jgi:hypothetical protein